MHRYTYCLDFGATSVGDPFGTLIKLDGASGQVREYRPGAGRYLGEGVFVRDRGPPPRTTAGS